MARGPRSRVVAERMHGCIHPGAWSIITQAQVLKRQMDCLSQNCKDTSEWCYAPAGVYREEGERIPPWDALFYEVSVD